MEGVDKLKHNIWMTITSIRASGLKLVSNNYEYCIPAS